MINFPDRLTEKHWINLSLILIPLFAAQVRGQSVNVTPTSASIGQSLTVTFTGTGSTKFSHFTETCGTFTYNASAYITSSVYLTTIYPTSIGSFSEGASTFSADFTIPYGTMPGIYNVVINPWGSCPVIKSASFTIVNGNSFVVSPAAASAEQTLAVTFSGVNGNVFSQFSTTCGSNVMQANTASIYFRQFTSTSKIFPVSVNSFSEGTSSVTANFVLPTGVYGVFDAMVNGSGNCPVIQPSAFIITPGPYTLTVTGFSPTIGFIGTNVTITGSNFDPIAANNGVYFNGVKAVVLSATSTQLVAVVPSGATTGTIAVIAKNQMTGLTQFFEVIQPPVISTFSPSVGPAGTSVTIAGTNFAASSSSNTVKFNGVVATSVTANSVTNLTAIVPEGATTGTISVTVGGQTAVSIDKFTVIPSPPAIKSFSPASGTAGTSVTISGANFDLIPANNVVKFNGVLANLSAVSFNSLSTTVPAGATTGKITVTTNGLTATSVDDFIVPAITTGDILLSHSGQTIIIYPNPANEEIVFGLENLERGKQVEVAIYDMLGRRLERKTAEGGRSLSLDIRHYVAGTYVAQVVQGQKIFSSQFVKK